MKPKTVALDGRKLKLSNASPLVLIAGPCVIEDEKKTLAIARELKRTAGKLGLGFIFKASYDKANRSSLNAYRGPGLVNGLRILAAVKEEIGVPVLTDVHCRTEVDAVARVADIVQIPAFLCRQTDLVVDCAKTGLPVNVKKGQFLAPEDMVNVVEKLEGSGNSRIILTERGTSFGYHNLVLDVRSLEIMKKTGYPVVFDATHAVQLPGGLGSATGGQREFIRPLARAAAVNGVAGIFVEVHPDPAKALSDGPNSLALKDVPGFLKDVLAIDRIAKKK